MSSKTDENTRRPANPGVPVTKPDTVYMTRQEKERRNGTAGNGGFKETATPAPVEKPAPMQKPTPPLAPLAASWPDAAASRVETTTLREPAAPKAPAAATVPKPPPPPSTRPAPPTPPPQPAAVAQASRPKVTKTIAVSFAVYKPDAKQVFVSGDFNGWSLNASPMRRHEDGRWETTVALVPGQHQYKFIVDGEWIADPAAQKNVPNDRGSLNSVLEARA